MKKLKKCKKNTKKALTKADINDNIKKLSSSGVQKARGEEEKQQPKSERKVFKKILKKVLTKVDRFDIIIKLSFENGHTKKQTSKAIKKLSAGANSESEKLSIAKRFKP